MLFRQAGDHACAPACHPVRVKPPPSSSRLLPYLRQRRGYYAVIGADLLLRFGWTATLLPASSFGVDQGAQWFRVQASWLQPAVAAAEISRRMMWALVRLEAEHLHNTEGFRRVQVRPREG